MPRPPAIGNQTTALLISNSALVLQWNHMSRRKRDKRKREQKKNVGRSPGNTPPQTLPPAKATPHSEPIKNGPKITPKSEVAPALAGPAGTDMTSNREVILDMLPIQRDMFHERYRMELNRRGQINDRIDARITLVSLFVGAIIYLTVNFPNYPDSPSSWDRWLFAVFLIGLVGLYFSVAMVGLFLVLALLNGKNYRYLPPPRQEHERHKVLRSRHILQDAAQGAKMAEVEIEKQFYDELLSVADDNDQNNTLCDDQVNWATFWIFTATATAILTAIFRVLLHVLL